MPTNTIEGTIIQCRGAEMCCPHCAHPHGGVIELRMGPAILNLHPASAKTLIIELEEALRRAIQICEKKP